MISGSTALVVEDEYMIALEVQRILEMAGGTAIIAAPGIAREVAPEHDRTFNLAIVALPPDNLEKAELCQTLRDRGVAVVVLTSGPVQDADLPDIGSFTKVVKPFTDHQLLAAAVAAIQQARPAAPIS